MTLFETLSKAPCDALTRCVGIDPTQDTLSAWGLDDTATGAQKFALTMLEAAHNNASIVKPQVAYFERFGAEGYRVLTDIIKEARSMGLLVLADAKRGDIGSTIDAYSQAWLGDKAPMQVDAITVTPYLGFGSLKPLLERAHDAGAYVFVVTRSSNPEGTVLQEHGSPKLWQTILDDIRTWEVIHGNKTIGAVVGATVPSDLKYALEQLPNAYFLTPGIGKQGAKPEDMKALTPDLKRIIVSSSRGLAAEGPEVTDIRAAITKI
ncbi:orotidine-5'-phosphate decarboxylase [Kiloniella litopenaei]|uniref:orotidine-5'-phosphate decarboxylase n=1 Tax=Kiloniella litopenaei TaxID=1549748 RepID=UPI003BAD824C